MPVEEVGKVIGIDAYDRILQQPRDPLEPAVMERTQVGNDVEDSPGLVAAQLDRAPDFPALRELTAEPEFADAVASVDSPKVTRFLEALTRPENARKSYGAIAAKCGLTPQDLVVIWRDYNLQKAFLRGVKQMPEIVEGIAENAKASKIACPRCDGAKEIEVRRRVGMVWINCPTCDGRGWVLKVGDAHSRTLMFKRVGWLKDGAGVQVVVNQAQSLSVESVIEELDNEAGIIEVESVPFDETTSAG